MASAEQEKQEHDGLGVFNYAVAFIDLLGQRNALKGEGLFTGTEDEQKFVATLRATIGTIARLQKRAADFFNASGPNPHSPIKMQIPPEHHELWDQMQKREVTIQRWSDGLVAYSNLGNEAVKCQMNNAYELIGYCGMICWLGLASRAPLRGGLEIAWGVELHPNELYGAAVARAYELESKCAKYPRVVVGPEMLRFIEMHSQNPHEDFFSQQDRTLARLCLDLLWQDEDGQYIVHYLGDAFIASIAREPHELYSAGLYFVDEQLELHARSGNAELQGRYAWLKRYFERFPRAPEKAGS